MTKQRQIPKDWYPEHLFNSLEEYQQFKKEDTERVIQEIFPRELCPWFYEQQPQETVEEKVIHLRETLKVNFPKLTEEEREVMVQKRKARWKKRQKEAESHLADSSSGDALSESGTRFD